MSKEMRKSDDRKPVVEVSTRKKHPGFTNPNKGIPVGPGCTIQDVPREVLVAHLRQSESYWKQRFNSRYSGSHGGVQTF